MYDTAQDREQNVYHPPHWLDSGCQDSHACPRAAGKGHIQEYSGPIGITTFPYPGTKVIAMPKIASGALIACGSLTWPWRTELNERQLDPVKRGRKGSLIKFCLKVSVFGFVPALICKGMRQVMAPQGLSGLCSQCQPSFSITLSLPAINFGPGSWGLVHLSLLIDTK